MKARQFKLNPVAVVVMLALAGPLAADPVPAAKGTGANAAASSTKKIHSAENDKAEASKEVKDSRLTRSTLRSTKDAMRATRQTLRR